MRGTFGLQWLGEADLRHKMQGRLVLVHLMCRDMAAKSTAVGNVAPEDDRGGYATGWCALDGNAELLVVDGLSNELQVHTCFAFDY